MSDTDSLSSRLGDELFSVSSVVILTAAVFALAAAYATQAWANGTTTGVGALIGVGIGVPTLYDEWAARISRSEAFLWTALASAIAAGVYALVFVFLIRFGVDAGLGDGLAGGAAVALAVAFSFYRTRTAGESCQ
jgi:heme A synthase